MKTITISLIALIIFLFSLYAYVFYLGGQQNKDQEIRTKIYHLQEQGYSQAWAEHIALVELNIIPADSLYIAIEED